jgi:DNA ligase-1
VYVDENGNFMEFQEIERKFKGNESVSGDLKQPKVLVFDVLAMNGENLGEWPLKYRKKVLAKQLNLGQEMKTDLIEAGFFQRLKHLESEEAITEIEKLQKYSESINCEGLVIKAAGSRYNTTGTRSSEWVKLKNQGMFTDSMQDTIDLVPIGAYFGKGTRAGIFGAYLLASYNMRDGVFESACKVGTGFTKDKLDELNEHFQGQLLTEKPSCYVTHLSERAQPAVWLLPNSVWEIGADSISKSPSYSLASRLMTQHYGFSSAGLSLRFPRFIKTREDKSLTGFNKLTEAQLLPRHMLQDLLPHELGTDSHEIFRLYKENLERKQNQI